MGVFGLTQISQIPLFLLMVGNLTEALRFVVFCGLTQIQRDSTRRLFVEICVNLWLKNLCKKNSRVGICGIKGCHKFFYKFSQIICGLKGLFLNIFTYLCLYMCQKTFRVMTTSNPHRHTKKRLIKTVGAHTPCSCGHMQGGGLYFYTFGMYDEDHNSLKI